MLPPGRSYSSNAYRYGFNGMEKDDEVSGNGNSYDFGARMYNPRLARWMAVDPLRSDYPSYTPYSFVNNMFTIAKDPDGKKIVIVGTREEQLRLYDTLVRLMNTKEGKRMVQEIAASNHTLTVKYVEGGDNKWIKPEKGGDQNLSTLQLNLLNDKVEPGIGDNKGDPVWRTPETSAGHELRHTEVFILGVGSEIELRGFTTDPSNLPEDGDIQFHEFDAVYFENVIREEFGIEIRNSYDGVIVYPGQPADYTDRDEEGVIFWPIGSGDYESNEYFYGRLDSGQETRDNVKAKNVDNSDPIIIE
jgi:RHS repeat-associated protein